MLQSDDKTPLYEEESMMRKGELLEQLDRLEELETIKVENAENAIDAAKSKIISQS